MADFRTSYLIAYNALQFVGWLYIFFAQNITYLAFFQTLQFIEVVHCAIGFVKSSAIQTFMQILSRLIVVWMAVLPYPETRDTIGYPMILFAWPVAETTRYLYYALNLCSINSYIVTWARYTFFIVLYPLGVTGELSILTKLYSIMSAGKLYTLELPNALNISFYGHYLLAFVMATYIPCK